MHFRIGVIRDLAIFTEKYLCKKSLFHKVAGLQAFIKIRLQHRCFLVNIAKFLRKIFFIEHLWWLLLVDIFVISSIP